MRSLSIAITWLLFAAVAPGQAIQPATPNAVRLTKFALGTADLDRSYAFYHALGLDLDNATALRKPSPLSEMLLKLVDVPAGTRFRNMMLKIPNAPFDLEMTEFSNLELRTAKPRIQDPGASLLIFMVDNLDAALATAKKAGAEVVTTGGSPVAGSGRGSRAVTISDPDGHYVELVQPRGVPPGSGKVIGAPFGSMVVLDSGKAASFYRDRFGFTVKLHGWTSESSARLGTPSAQTRSAGVTIPGTNLTLGFIEFKGVDRKTYISRIPDPGTPAIGLQVRDIDAAVAAVKAAGGVSITQGGSVRLGKGKIGFVRDPSGILAELTQP